MPLFSGCESQEGRPKWIPTRFRQQWCCCCRRLPRLSEPRQFPTSRRTSPQKSAAQSKWTAQFYMQPNTQYYGSNYHHRYNIYFDIWRLLSLIFFIMCEDMMWVFNWTFCWQTWWLNFAILKAAFFLASPVTTKNEVTFSPVTSGKPSPTSAHQSHSAQTAP